MNGEGGAGPCGAAAAKAAMPPPPPRRRGSGAPGPATPPGWAARGRSEVPGALPSPSPLTTRSRAGTQAEAGPAGGRTARSRTFRVSRAPAAAGPPPRPAWGCLGGRDRRPSCGRA
uniref:Hes family bHLH transcription factor 2 n=1 Tax=Pipistrellus kuhlii TaxID=59472 RepID=A0A7J7T0Z7_PIPKU|nr:hes family bHLH transcription factor 2 [Pipistrellus kuhlii]